jgi:F-type H+-transporting ATPase subunit b
MNINLTLIGQSITFVIFVWFCLKFVWPPIMGALVDRKKLIADGLAAGEKGKHDLELAEKKAVTRLKEAKSKAAEIINHAEKRAGEIVDEAKDHAKVEADRIVAGAQSDIDQEVNRAREELRKSVATLAVAGASKILEKEVDAKAHAKMVDSLVAQL